MKLERILEVIDLRKKDLGLSDQKICTAAGGSKDLIRNWRRKLASGEKDARISADKLTRIAEVLDLPLDALMEGFSGELPPPSRAQAALREVLDIRLRNGRLTITADLDAAGVARLQRSLAALAPLLEQGATCPVEVHGDRGELPSEHVVDYDEENQARQRQE